MFVAIPARGKSHLVPDALAQLATTTDLQTSTKDYTVPIEGELDALNGSAQTNVADLRDCDSTSSQGPNSTGSLGTVLVEMSNDFKKRLVAGYKADPRWSRIMDQISENSKLDPEDVAKLPFEVHDQLIFRTSLGMLRRLCIPPSCMHNIFELAHNHGHPGYAKMIQLVADFCILNVSRHLRDYLKHCSEC